MNDAAITTADLAGLDVAVWGYGRDTAAFVRALERDVPTARVTVIGDQPLDDATAAELRARGHAVADEIASRVIETTAFHVVVRSPGVSIYRPEIAAAKRRGTLVTTTLNLWFAEKQQRPLKIIGITGSKGKSTTSSLVAHLLAAAGERTLCCGNIGVPLFDERIDAADTLVVELSSYQLADFKGRVDAGALLNLYPEHLDWHGGVDAYYRDKQRLFDAQESGDIAVLPPELSDVGARLSRTRRVVYFDEPDGFHLRDDGVYDRNTLVLKATDSPLSGRHNLRNVAAALTIVRASGSAIAETVLDAIRTFHPLRHRLQPVAEVAGVAYVNDSISTIPEAALAAADAFLPRPVTLIVGGHDRGLDWRAFAERLAERPLNAIVGMPNTGHVIADALWAMQGPPFRVMKAATLDEAVTLAADATPAGGVVLLSPAAPSYNTFRNFEERGDAFIALVNARGARIRI